MVCSHGQNVIAGGDTFKEAPVTSTVTQHTKTTFWIVDGQDDRHIELGTNFPIRDGQQARLIWGAGSETDTGDYLFVKNDATGKYLEYKDNKGLYSWAVGNRLIPPNYANFVGWFCFIAFWVGAFSSKRIPTAIMNFIIGPLLLVAVIAWIIGAIRKSSRMKFVRSQIHGLLMS